MKCILFFGSILSVESVMSVAGRFHHNGAIRDARARISHFTSVSLVISRCNGTALNTAQLATVQFRRTTEKGKDLKSRRNTQNTGFCRCVIQQFQLPVQPSVMRYCVLDVDVHSARALVGVLMYAVVGSLEMYN